MTQNMFTFKKLALGARSLHSEKGKKPFWRGQERSQGLGTITSGLKGQVQDEAG